MIKKNKFKIKKTQQINPSSGLRVVINEKFPAVRRRLHLPTVGQVSFTVVFDNRRRFVNVLNLKKILFIYVFVFVFADLFKVKQQNSKLKNITNKQNND